MGAHVLSEHSKPPECGFAQLWPGLALPVDVAVALPTVGALLSTPCGRVCINCIQGLLY